MYISFEFCMPTIRDNIHADEVLNESQNSLMDTETTEAQRRNETYDGVHEVIDSDSSISSEPSSEGEGDEDDDDEDEHNGGGDGKFFHFLSLHILRCLTVFWL